MGTSLLAVANRCDHSWRGPVGPAARTRSGLCSHAMRLLLRVGNAKRLGVDLVKLGAFVEAASLQYRDNPYHNWLHAVDVTHTAAWFVTRPRMRKLLSPLEVFWLLIAAITHDLDHPGHSNRWETLRESAWAKRYDNQSVLENHSIDQALALLRTHGCQFSDSMPAYASSLGETLLRDLILATDFAGHAAFMARFQNTVHRVMNRSEVDWNEFRQLLLMALLKASDIGNVAKPFVQATFWADRIMKEFWAEGRLERRAGFPVSAQNDEKSTLKRAQMGFIEHVATGLFHLINLVDAGTQPLTESALENLGRYHALPDPPAKAAALGAEPGLVADSAGGAVPQS